MTDWKPSLQLWRSVPQNSTILLESTGTCLTICGYYWINWSFSKTTGNLTPVKDQRQEIKAAENTYWLRTGEVDTVCKRLLNSSNSWPSNYPVGITWQSTCFTYDCLHLILLFVIESNRLLFRFYTNCNTSIRNSEAFPV